MLPTFFNSWIKRPTFPADTDVFRASSGHLKKVTTSYDQTRRLQDVWQKTSDLRRIEDVLFTSSWRRPISNILKTSYLRRLEDVGFTLSWRRLIYNVLKTSDFWRLGDVWFTKFWRRLIYDVLKTSDLRLLDDLCKTTSVEEAMSAQCQNVFIIKIYFLILYFLKYWENLKCSA